MKNLRKEEGLTVYRLGCWVERTQWRDPTTGRHGHFWLLGYPVWPDSRLFNQPGPAGLLQPAHIDAGLSADTWSPYTQVQEWIPVSSHPLVQASQEQDYRYSPRTQQYISYMFQDWFLLFIFRYWSIRWNIDWLINRPSLYRIKTKWEKINGINN